MGPFSQNQNFGYYGEQKKRLPIKMIVIVLAVVAVLVIIISVIGASAKADSIGTQSAHLSARLTNLSALTAAAPQYLASGDLKKINAETDIITDGVGADLSGILPKKPDKSIVADESDATDTSALANAALASTYDSQYKTVLGEKLESITALLTEMSAKTNSKTTRALIERDNVNYQALLTDLSKITL